MSKFLTPPVWYDKNGNLNQMLTGDPGTSSDIAIGPGTTATGGGVAINGTANRGGVAINGSATNGGTAIGYGAYAIGDDNGDDNGGIAIGYGAYATANQIKRGNNLTAYTLNVGDGTGTINIGTINGVRLSASGGVIQLGNNNTAYTLNVGNGTGTSKIGALSFDEVASTDIQSKGLYLCTATNTQTGAGVTTTFGYNAFLWIETKESTTATAKDGSATFTYSKTEGQSNWAIRVSGADSDTLKCYRVFSL